MIYLLIGDDHHNIESEIKRHKGKIPDPWCSLNFNRFSSDNLAEGLIYARSVALGSEKKLVVIENCNFRQFGNEGFELLQSLPYLPTSTILIFTAATIDRRLKVSKFLLKHGQVKEFSLIPPWRLDLIAASIKSQAKQLRLQLSNDAISYLAEAIGNNTARAEKELEKLAVYASDGTITRKQAEKLVNCTTQTSLQLAEAVKQKQVDEATQLLEELLAYREHPLAILATLTTQFRTWLWVKVAIEGGKGDSEVVQLCKIGNPKRLYYLRREVADTSCDLLITSLSMLCDLESRLKQGATSSSLLPGLLRIILTPLLRPTP